MKSKRTIVIIISLIMLTLTAGIAVAQVSHGILDDVWWFVYSGRSSKLGSSQTGSHYIEVYNKNDYAVRIELNTNRGVQRVELDARETRHFNFTSGRVIKVVKL